MHADSIYECIGIGIRNMERHPAPAEQEPWDTAAYLKSAPPLRDRKKPNGFFRSQVTSVKPPQPAPPRDRGQFANL
eukprot:2045030-Rhodomonas_salina.1